MAVWLAVLTALSLAQLAVLVLLLVRRAKGEGHTATRSTEAREERHEPERDPIDEGIENIMKFQVSGHTGLPGNDG